jgi:hypothetical protein
MELHKKIKTILIILACLFILLSVINLLYIADVINRLWITIGAAIGVLCMIITRSNFIDNRLIQKINSIDSHTAPDKKTVVFVSVTGSVTICSIVWLVTFFIATFFY